MLNLIVATQAEADPVISALKLNKISTTHNCYQKEETHLVVSGIGKCNAATACGWLAHKTIGLHLGINTSMAWLNIGISGHPIAELGSAFMAHKVTDMTSERVWYPHRLNNDLPSSDLITVDKPLSHYLPEQLHDMEASAFMESARQFSNAELVQALKVVSDNETQSVSKVNAKLATTIIDDRIESILGCIQTLTALSHAIQPPDNTTRNIILDQWHFSVAQTVQLERLLQRHKVHLGSLTAIPDSLQRAKSSRDVLTWLQNKLDSTDCTL